VWPLPQQRPLQYIRTDDGKDAMKKNLRLGPPLMNQVSIEATTSLIREATSFCANPSPSYDKTAIGETQTGLHQQWA
jgi:hypothetical protein